MEPATGLPRFILSVALMLLRIASVQQYSLSSSPSSAGGRPISVQYS